MLHSNTSSSGVHCAGLSRFHFKSIIVFFFFWRGGLLFFGLTFLSALNGLEEESANPP